MHNTSTQQASAKVARSTIRVAITHAVSPVLWLIFMIFMVPRFAAILSDMTDGQTALPLLTKIVLNCSQFFTSHWYIYLALLSLVLVIDATVYYILARHIHKALAYTWYLLISLAQLAITLLLIAAIILPVYKMAALTG